MNCIFQFDCTNVDWERVAEVMREAPLSDRTPELLQKTFENSQLVMFAIDNGKIVGMGRAITDFTAQAAIYDICIHPKYQRRGLATLITERLIKMAGVDSVILFTVPGRESFYEGLGFRMLKTGMGYFTGQKLERMEQGDYI